MFQCIGVRKFQFQVTNKYEQKFQPMEISKNVLFFSINMNFPTLSSNCRMRCVDVSQFIYVKLIPWPFVRDDSIIFRVISFLAYYGHNLGCHLLQQKDVIVLANIRDCDGRDGP